MDMSRQVFSIDQAIERKTKSGSSEKHVSTAVRFHVEGNFNRVRRVMSANDSVPPHLLMQNVRDIRKRLLETEKTLNTLTKAEAKLDQE